ncbi:glycine/sarcosine/betaine reductase selenoprotein B family protein [Thermodesulfobacteriota bacterium]
MARLEQLEEVLRTHLEKLPCPSLETQPWASGPELSKRRVSIISTAGIHRRDDRPFTMNAIDVVRVIPGDIRADDFLMTHVSTNFDHSGFQQDINILFPIDRLRELSKEGVIGSVADFHYSFMGAQDPMNMEEAARNIAVFLKKDNVDAALLVPV